MIFQLFCEGTRDILIMGATHALKGIPATAMVIHPDILPGAKSIFLSKGSLLFLKSFLLRLFFETGLSKNEKRSSHNQQPPFWFCCCTFKQTIKTKCPLWQIAWPVCPSKSRIIPKTERKTAFNTEYSCIACLINHFSITEISENDQNKTTTKKQSLSFQ